MISTPLKTEFKRLHMIGFGSQGRAWAECLRLSGWDVEVFLSRKGSSYEEALKAGYSPRLLSELSQTLSAPMNQRQTQPSSTPTGATTEAPSSSKIPALIAMLCPDQFIGTIYREYLANLEAPMTLVLAHGYAVYADDLKPARAGHEIALFAPKAIGPKLEAARKATPAGEYHPLVAGVCASPERMHQLHALAEALGFARERLVPATFDQEAIGDMISEQGLLCGGVFTLLEWTLEAMEAAGIPPKLIREECFRELELIAGLIHERGPASTFQKISQAAQCGTVVMRERLQNSTAKEEFQKQLQDVVSKRFVRSFNDPTWKEKASELTRKLKDWEERL